MQRQLSARSSTSSTGTSVKTRTSERRKNTPKPKLPNDKKPAYGNIKADNQEKALLDKVKAYNPTADLALLRKAIDFCKTSHTHQKRASGDPYYTHPLAVAHILADRKLDTDSVITGLLHDVVEDTLTSTEEIKAEFNKEIALLVDGVTKLTDLEKESLAAVREAGGNFRALAQGANYRKMFIAISRDVRVLLVKLADRLHNMRTLDYIEREEKRQRIARETLLVYAPLAERIGVYLWKTELQDLAFRQLNGRAYREIEAHLHQIKGDEKQLQAIGDEIKDLLARHKIKAQVTSRLKNPASIWQKMEKRGIALRELADIMAFRVIVKDVTLCYRALCIIHGEFRSFFDGFRDYISSPKPNGYQSLHTAVAGPNKNLIEIQIRTESMHEHSENGIAAHWRYKSGDGDQKKINKNPTGRLAWLRDMMERLERLEEDPETAMQAVRLDLYQDQVFCFTPQHDVIALRAGAVLLDFAYAVHTEVGHKCTGGRINGREQPINHVLQNGDRVEIITADTQTPHESWQEVAQTQNARNAIQHYFRHRDRRQKIKLGEDRLRKFFATQRADYTDDVPQKAIQNFQDNKSFHQKIKTPDDLLYNVASLQIEPAEVLFAAYPGHNKKLRQSWRAKSGAEKFITGLKKHLFSDRGALIVNHPDTHFALNFANCCRPVPGDKIVGIKTIGLGVSLHRSDCQALHNVIALKDRWMEATWSPKFYGKHTYCGRLKVTLKNDPGTLGKACDIIGELGINIADLKFLERVSDYYSMTLDLDVTDIKQLQKAIRNLNRCPEVNKAIRT